MMSPAAAAKARKRRSVRVITYAEDGDDEECSQKKKKPRSTSVPIGAIVSGGGMVEKTDFALARSQLAARSSTGVVAAQECQSALVGKGLYRKEESVAQEQPVGVLATNEMPRRKEFVGSEPQHQKKFQEWMRSKLTPKARAAPRHSSSAAAQQQRVRMVRTGLTGGLVHLARGR